MVVVEGETIRWQTNPPGEARTSPLFNVLKLYHTIEQQERTGSSIRMVGQKESLPAANAL